MRTTAFLLALSLALLIGCSKEKDDEIVQLKKENVHLKTLVGPPPASLDSLYPPVVQAPVYKIKMFELAGSFTGFVTKVNEGDRKGAKALFDAFKAQYLAASQLVPDWKDAFPTQPLDELSALIDQGEPGRVMEAVGEVGKVCHDCHVSNMAKVQQKYHWGEFSDISISDPVTGRNLQFNEFMMQMEMSFGGIGMELQEGQVENAREHFEAFRSRLKELKEACQVCHDTERKYFVDAGVDALISKLRMALKTSTPDMKVIGGVSQQIGSESCGKCHLVHIPAAYAKAGWKKWEQAPK